MKLPRLTVRRLMAIVAVAAVVLGLDAWRRRYVFCEAQAARCASNQRAHLMLVGSHEQIAALYRKYAADRRGSVRYNTEQAAIYDRAVLDEQDRARKAVARGEEFRRAARYPWLALPSPDPPGIDWTDPGERHFEAFQKEMDSRLKELDEPDRKESRPRKGRTGR
jgi:hypothetical protein